MNWVVDASVVVKWYIPEIHSSEAVAFLDWVRPQRGNLVAPELLVLEVGNTILKKLFRKELTLPETLGIIRELHGVGFHFFPDRLLVAGAMPLAVEMRTSLYDALYLSLAHDTNAYFLTADREFIQRLKGKGPGKRVVWIEEWQTVLSP